VEIKLKGELTAKTGRHQRGFNNAGQQNPHWKKYNAVRELRCLWFVWQDKKNPR
jgi:hypothetical protein